MPKKNKSIRIKVDDCTVLTQFPLFMVIIRGHLPISDLGQASKEFQSYLKVRRGSRLAVQDGSASHR